MDYYIYITPLDETGRAYGTVVDVTKDIDTSEDLIDGGISPIRQEVDQGEYDIGVFNYANLSITLNNTTGKFNERYLDDRSIFPSIRDRAIIKLVFVDSDSTETFAFEGLIADRATTQDLDSGRITFTLLGLDSILSQNIVYSGSIPNGTLFSDAFRIVLNVPGITEVLGFSAANINPALDFEIDDGSKFDNLTAKQAVDQLLFASVSVLYIDENRNIIVKGRDMTAGTAFAFYMNHPYQDDNFFSIIGFNNGLQRLFNVVVINGYARRNTASISIYRERLKNIACQFITDVDSKILIADEYLDEFALPRDEFYLVTETSTAKDIQLFDPVTVYYDFIDKRYRGNPVAIYDADSYDEAYYSNPVGQLQLISNVKYKVMGIFKTPGNTFTTTLKLRKTTEFQT